MIDACELSPSYIRAIAPYQPGKPISELAREMGLDEASIVKLASNENPLGTSPQARRAIEAQLADVARYPDGNGFDLKQALAAPLSASTMSSIVLGNGSNDVLEMVGARFSRAPATSAVYVAACLRRLSAGDAGGGRDAHRRAGQGLRPRPRRDGGRGARRIRAWSGSPIRTIRPAPSCRRRSSKLFCSACRARSWWCWTRPTTSICPTRCRSTRCAGCSEFPEPGRHAHVLQGVRSRRPARRLRAGASGSGRSDESRAPAVQRQHHRAGRRGRRA